MLEYHSCQLTLHPWTSPDGSGARTLEGRVQGVVLCAHSHAAVRSRRAPECARREVSTQSARECVRLARVRAWMAASGHGTIVTRPMSAGLIVAIYLLNIPSLVRPELTQREEKLGKQAVPPVRPVNFPIPLGQQRVSLARSESSRTRRERPGATDVDGMVLQ